MSRNNQCFVVGNIGSDPAERGKGGKGGPIVGFTVAEDVQSFDADSGSYKTLHTNWFQVTAFGNMAERVKRGVRKGDRVVVRGRMKVYKYKAKTGEERNGFEILADDVALWKTLPAAEGGRPDARAKGPSRDADPSEDSIPF